MKRAFSAVVCLLIGTGLVAQQRAFVVGKRSWVSKQAFIDSGLRCATREPDEDRKAAIADDARRVLAQRGLSDAASAAGTVTFPVYVHPITSQTRRGIRV